MVRHKSRPRTGLLQGILENVRSDAFDEIPDMIAELLGGEAGIYVLYKDTELYYVGLAKNLKYRLQEHKKDRHAGKWNKFSIFKVKKVRYLKDLETLVLRISRPKGNRVMGRVSTHLELGSKFRHMLRRKRRSITRIYRGQQL